MEKEKLREMLANYSHDAWSQWMKYLFKNGTFNDDGTFTIPGWATHRWSVQSATPYKNLTEKEKDSDRKEADMMIEIFNNAVLAKVQTIADELKKDVDVLPEYPERLHAIIKEARG